MAGRYQKPNLSLIEKDMKKYEKANDTMNAIINKYGSVEELNRQRNLYRQTKLLKYHNASKDYQKYYFKKRIIEKMRESSQFYDPPLSTSAYQSQDPPYNIASSLAQDPHHSRTPSLTQDSSFSTVSSMAQDPPCQILKIL